MTVKDVVKVQAMLLGMEEVVDYVSGKVSVTDSATKEATDIMCRCVNLTISELAGTYIPMTSSFSATKEEIEFKDFPHSVIEIIEVTDQTGKPKKFDFTPLKISGLKLGDIIEYAYLPKEYGMDDEIGYTETEVPIRLLAYASSAEYSLVERAFDEAIMWRNRFVEELKTVLKPKNFKIKARRWS